MNSLERIDHQIIKERLEKAFAEKEVFEKGLHDFSTTFTLIGLDIEEASLLAQKVIFEMSTPQPLVDSERNVRKIFEETKIDGKNFLQTLGEKVDNRSEIIFNQVAPYFQATKGKVIDWGTGDGQVAQFLHDTFNLDIEGVDVKSFKAPMVTIPVNIFDGYYLEVPDDYYEAALLTNVLHHEKENEKIIEELSRVVSNKLVIIETIPVGDTENESKIDFERTFVNDVLWNRYFKDADIPVPGTYETVEGWIARFQKWGWKVFVSENLGYDQPTIRDVHHLFVFER